tara:strand:+ start:2751 stop:3101 length:351 start_codon:yes stop_codon:yes gene_type:complete
MNKNPSPDNQFKAGKSGNPGGKAKGQREAEIKSAEIAAKMRLKILSSLQEKFKDDNLSDEDYGLLLSAGTLKLFKDSEDRAFGTAQQHVDNTSSDSSMAKLFLSISERGKTVNDKG